MSVIFHLDFVFVFLFNSCRIEIKNPELLKTRTVSDFLEQPHREGKSLGTKKNIFLIRFELIL